MARLLLVGAETRTLATEGAIDVGTGTPVGISTSVYRSGAASFVTPALQSGLSHRARFSWSTSAQNGPHYARFYLRVAERPSAANRIFAFVSTSPFNRRASMQLTAAGALELWAGGTLLGTSAALGLDTWVRVEVRFLRVANGSDELHARLDGVEWAGSTTTTVNSGVASIEIGANIEAEAQTQGAWYFDDVVVDNAAYPGEGALVVLRPNAAGDFAEGSPGAGSGAAWERLRDTPTPDGATSDWILVANATSSTTPDRLDVALDDAATVGIGAADTILAVAVNAQVANGGSAASNFVVRLKSQPSGTLAESAAVSFNSAAPLINGATPASVPRLVSTVDPQGGGAWTRALLDAAQAGIRAPDANPDVRVSALWVTVEYVPAAGGFSGSQAAAWQVGARAAGDASWSVLTRAERAAAWQVLRGAAQAASWSVLTRAERAAAWQVLRGVAQAASWAVLARAQGGSAWRVLAAGERGAAWQVAARVAADTGWAVVTRERADTAWAILAAGLGSQALAWQVGARAAAPSAWRVLVGGQAAGAWQVLGVGAEALSWQLLTAAAQAGGWQVLGAGAAGTAWQVRALDEADLAWALLATGGTQPTAWEVLTRQVAPTAWRVLSAELPEPVQVYLARRRPLLYHARTRTLVYLAQPRTLVYPARPRRH